MNKCIEMTLDTNELLIFLCILTIFASTGIIGVDLVGASAGQGANAELETQSSLSFSERKSIVSHTNNITVISSDIDNKRNDPHLTAFTSGGQLLYHDSTFDRYYDVDPSSTGRTTVEFVGVRYITRKKTLNLIQRVNLTTGEAQTLYSHVVENDGPHRWHDVDRIDSHRFVVANIQRDSVSIINTTTQEQTYRWDAQANYPLSGGGSWPTDWTHLNDVEVLDDGRIMVSLRNQDQVVFLRPGEGVLENQTLGAENEYNILNEQHNPDYIPEERGGPAVLVADSQNNRVVEYQRQNGSWMQSWEWSDPEMQWPRDADRLPNGNTLIADSNSERILEVNESGDVVWQISGISNYDVERLGTGDESSGGYSARELNLSSRTIQVSSQSSASDRNSLSLASLRKTGYDLIKSILPSKLVNALLFTVPWMSMSSVLALIFDATASVFLIVLLFRRSSYNLRLPLARSGRE